METADKEKKAGPPACNNGKGNGKRAPGSLLQAIWGIMLIAAGLGVFVRIQQVMPKVPAFDNPVGHFGFYLIGIILIGGGARKVYAYFRGRRAC